MYKVLKLSTKEIFLVSNLETYQENSGYIIEPDLSSLEEVDKKYWKVVGTTIQEMTQEEKDAVDADELVKYKENKIVKVDEKTSEIISAGVVFDGHVFSLSQEAQLNWNSIYTSMQGGLIPADVDFEVSTRDPENGKYTLTPDKRLGFFGTILSTVNSYVSSGRQLRDAIKKAATKEEVDVIVDDR